MNPTIKKAAGVLRALNNKTRTRLMDLMRRDGEITVTKMYTKLRMKQSVVSQHLKILRQAGVVEMRRDGKFIYYQVNENAITLVDAASKKMIIIIPGQEIEPPEVGKAT